MELQRLLRHNPFPQQDHKLGRETETLHPPAAQGQPVGVVSHCPWAFWMRESTGTQSIMKGLFRKDFKGVKQKQPLLPGGFQKASLKRWHLGLHKWIGFLNADGGKGHAELRDWVLWEVCRFGTSAGQIQILAFPLLAGWQLLDISEPVSLLQSRDGSYLKGWGEVCMGKCLWNVPKEILGVASFFFEEFTKELFWIVIL